MADAKRLIENLVRDGRLQEARRVGEEAVAADPHDDGALEALVGLYLELEAQCISSGVTGYLDEIGRRLDELIGSMSRGGDKARRRHERLRLSMVPGYDRVAELEELSARDGHESEAYSAAKEMFASGEMSPAFYEIYGTIIYRYARVVMTEASSVPVRKLLFEYLGLPLVKPSRLHSLMLRLAVRCARKYPDFNFTRFFDLWNPRTLRPDDMAGAEGHMSLAATAFELVIDSDGAYEFPALLERVKATAARRMAIVREAFAALVSRQIKAGDTSRAIDLLELYGRHGAVHASDASHSRLLSLALRVMDGDEMWRFVAFFINWDSRLLRPADFEPVTTAGGETVQPLAARAFNRVFAALRADVGRHAHLLDRVLEAFDAVSASKAGMADELTARRRAMLLAWMERDDEALERMSAMAMEGRRSAAFWLDFSDMAPSRQLQTALLALGALRLDDEGRDDADRDALRLRLARLLHAAGDDDAAATELDRISMAAEPLPAYGAVKSAIGADATPNYSNELLYHRLAADALAMIYRRVESERLSVIERRDNVIVAVGSAGLPALIDSVLWPLLSRLEPGGNVEVKRTSGGIVMARSVDGEPYSSLDARYGIMLVGGRVQCAGRPEPVPCDEAAAAVGEPVKVRVYLDAEGCARCVGATVVPMAEARRHFDHVTAAIYAVDGSTVKLSAGEGLPQFETPADVVEPGAAGSLREIYYYVDTRGAAHVVASSRPGLDVRCDALRQVSGRLALCPDGTATVRDVEVPSSLLKLIALSDNTFVSGMAVYTPEGWQAISLDPYT